MLSIQKAERKTLDVGDHTVHCTNIHYMADGSRVLVNFAEETSPASFPVQDLAGFSAEDGKAQLSYFLDALGVDGINIEPGQTAEINSLPVAGVLRAKDGYINWVLQAFRPAEIAVATSE